MVHKLVNKAVITTSLIIALLYFCVLVFLLNYQLVWYTVISDFKLVYKMQLLITLVMTAYTTSTFANFIGMIAIACLVGFNTSILIKNIQMLRSKNRLHFIVGGSSLIGLISGGCAACGLSLISFLGIGSSVIYTLPFKGLEITLLTIGLLAISSYSLLKQNRTYCNLK